MKYRLYAVPKGPQRRMDFVAAPSLKAAKVLYPQARLAEHDELEAAVADLMSVQRLTYTGKLTAEFAEPKHFISEDRTTVGKWIF